MWCSGMSLAGSSCSHFGSSLGSDGAQPLGVLSDTLGKGAVSSWVRGAGRCPVDVDMDTMPGFGAVCREPFPWGLFPGASLGTVSVGVISAVKRSLGSCSLLPEPFQTA